jgi:hypothetical protein
MVKKQPQWRCPKCGHRFVTKNLSHSCGHYKLQDHFAGKPGELRKTFEQLVAIARRFGPVTVYAQKTRIVLQARVRFAGATVRKEWLDAHLWLRRKAQHPLMTRIESFGPLGYGCYFRLRNVSDLDQRMTSLIEEAYASQK